MTVKLKLKGVRLSYPQMYKARDFQGNADFQYSAVFLIEKGSEAEKQVEAAIAEVAKEAWPKTWQKDVTQLKAQGSMKCCFVDGDDSGKDGYEGHFALTAKRKQSDGRPAVAGRDGSPLNEGDEGTPYGGCYVVASVEIYTQDSPSFGKGLRAGLRGVQFLKDGKSFGGAAPVGMDEFEDLGEEFADLV